ncbi:uncharacterized protein LOC110246427, partial [Exaiptasia diaphana]|uniref:Solute-binding protein family 5 domain-containing protein n=1 Tax=Exaiptasia diaphana TaxID=2652724 RepID=A0A913XR70_EXADI
MPSKTASYWILLLIGLVVLSVGCDAPNEPEPKVFRYQLTSAPATLDPALAGDTASGGVIDRLFDGLMKLDRSTDQPVADLAEPFLLSDDGLVYSFQLKSGVLFHSGRPIQASDYRASWERLLAPENDSPNAWLFELVEGAEAFRNGTVDTVSGIEVEDPYVLRIRLVRPFAPFPYHLAAPAASVVPIEDVVRLGGDFERQP